MKLFLLSILEPFRFRKHQREQRAQEHQWALELEQLRMVSRGLEHERGLELADKAVAQEQEGLRLEREHQFKLAQAFTSSLTSMQEASKEAAEVNADALIEMAKAVAANADSFSAWIKSFQLTTSTPSSSVVTDQDELLKEQMKLMQAGLPVELADLPEELRLAYVLKNDPNSWLGSDTV